MFRFPPGVRCAVLATAFLLSLADLGLAADRGVVRASRQVAEEEPPADDRKAEPATINDADVASYSPNWPEPPNTGAMLLRLAGGTVFVLLLSVGSIWFGKPWLQRLRIAGPNSSTFQIEGSVVLGQRAMLHLVRVGDTQLVAGTDATGLKSLIALPMSFKDVLGEQIPESDIPAATSTATATAVPSMPTVSTPRPLDTRMLFRPTGQGMSDVER